MFEALETYFLIISRWAEVVFQHWFLFLFSNVKSYAQGHVIAVNDCIHYTILEYGFGLLLVNFFIF